MRPHHLPCDETSEQAGLRYVNAVEPSLKYLPAKRERDPALGYARREIKLWEHPA
jgi:hypothetical protein